MKKVFGIALALGLLSASAALADSGSGCGLGKQIWAGQKGVVPHLLAATTNVTSVAPVSMTSGTSGCTADGIILREKEREVFVAANLDPLSQEMAQGDGGHLQSLAGLMGCSAAYGDFAAMTQARYPVLFESAATGTVDLLAGLKREIAADPKLAAMCRPLS